MEVYQSLFHLLITTTSDWCIVLVEMPLTRFEEWVQAYSDGISFGTPLKPQHSNPNPNLNRLANQLWCIDFLTPPTPLIIPHRLPAFLESLMPLKNWCSIHQDAPKAVWRNLLHIVLLKCQIAFLKFTSCDNQALVGGFPIAAVAVHLKMKS